MRCQVKICGITSVQDAHTAIEAGADALGFVFYPPSPRHLELARAQDILNHVPADIATVAVLVDPTWDHLLRLVETCPINVLQFHGHESPDVCQKAGRLCHGNHARPHRQTPGSTCSFLEFSASPNVRIIKAFRVKDASALEGLGAFPTDAWLLDSYVPGQVGGTGERFNWNLVSQAKALGRPVILAGGLTPDNVAAAVRQTRPYAVDVSSGVERSPGVKDPARVRAFIQAVREASQEP